MGLCVIVLVFLTNIFILTKNKRENNQEINPGYAFVHLYNNPNDSTAVTGESFYLNTSDSSRTPPLLFTHLVRQAAGFCAAAVIGRRGSDEPSRAGVCGVLAVTHTFKHITALCFSL